MLGDASVLAVVPARSGSTGVPDKNMQQVGGRTLIARAAEVVAALPWIDLGLISTDSADYAAEGERAGLAAPFLRPPELSGPAAPALDTIAHALDQGEAHAGRRFDLVLLLEPTSPNRSSVDVEAAARLLAGHPEADSVVTVSEIDSKFHPGKLLEVHDGLLAFHSDAGAAVVARQQLRGHYFTRNGACYALRRRCLTDRLGIITDRTLPLVIDRPLANVDTPLDLAWARFLWAEEHPDQEHDPRPEEHDAP